MAVGAGGGIDMPRGSLPSRVAAVEYQGAVVKLRLEADWGGELTVTQPDQSFYVAPVAEGDIVAIEWDDSDVHIVG